MYWKESPPLFSQKVIKGKRLLENNKMDQKATFFNSNWWNDDTVKYRRGKNSTSKPKLYWIFVYIKRISALYARWKKFEKGLANRFALKNKFSRHIIHLLGSQVLRCRFFFIMFWNIFMWFLQRVFILYIFQHRSGLIID